MYVQYCLLLWNQPRGANLKPRITTIPVVLISTHHTVYVFSWNILKITGRKAPSWFRQRLGRGQPGIVSQIRCRKDFRSRTYLRISKALYFCKYAAPLLYAFRSRAGSRDLAVVPSSRLIAGVVLNIGSKTSKPALPSSRTSKPTMVNECPNFLSISGSKSNTKGEGRNEILYPGVESKWGVNLSQ